MNQLILSLILSVLPITELRVGLPLAIDYAIKNNLSIVPIFLLILGANVFIIFLIFLFLDFLHLKFLRIKCYKRTFNFFLERTRKKAGKVKKNMEIYGFLGLTLFVAVPLPITGAWTGCLIAWILGLDRKKSILAISLGVLVAGILVLLTTLGVLGLIKII